jgi:hypothetical protein
VMLTAESRTEIGRSGFPNSIPRKSMKVGVNAINAVREDIPDEPNSKT